MKPRLRIHFRLKQAHSLHTEWTFDHPVRITIGFDPHASIWLLDPQAGPFSELFRRRGNDVQFRIGEKLVGDLMVEGKPISLSSLRGAGLLQSDKEGTFIVLREKTSGSLRLGDTHIEFWITPAPKQPEYPLHPAPVRILRNVPKLLVLMLLLSLVGHGGLVEWIKGLPPPREPTLDEVNRTFVRFKIPEKNFIRDRLRATEGRATPTTSPQQEAENTVKPPAPSSMGGFLAAVTKREAGGKASPFSSLFSTQSLGKSLSESLGGRSLEAAVSEQLKKGGGGTFSSGDAPKTVGIGSIRENSGAKVALQKEVQAPVYSRLSVGTADSGGVMDPEEIRKVIAANSGQFRECYERSLARKPGLAGKLVISLGLTAEGRPGTVSIEETSLSDAAMERCVVERIQTLVFPPPKGGSAKVRFPLIFSGATRG